MAGPLEGGERGVVSPLEGGDGEARLHTEDARELCWSLNLCCWPVSPGSSCRAVGRPGRKDAPAKEAPPPLAGVLPPATEAPPPLAGVWPPLDWC